MDRETKTFRMAIKDLDAEGKFRGYLSVFNVVDHGGDLVEPGAFRKTLRQTRAFPLLWAHSAQEPGHVIGTFGAQEDKFGLLVDGEFFMDQPGGQEAHGVVRRLKDRGVKVGLSIGYKADKWKMEEDENERTIRRLKEVQLFEGSMTLFPMNEAALVQAVKDGLEGAPTDKEIEFRCGNCGETTLVIKNSEPDDKAFDTQEPEKTIPADEPSKQDEEHEKELVALRTLAKGMKSRQE